MSLSTDTLIISEDQEFEGKHPRGKGGRFAKAAAYDTNAVPFESRIVASPDSPNDDPGSLKAFEAVHRGVSGIDDDRSLSVDIRPMLPISSAGSNDVYGHLTVLVAQSYKAHVVGTLAQDSGLPEDVVDAFIREWANSSNKTWKAIAAQVAAHQLFGSPLSKWQKKMQLHYEYIGKESLGFGNPDFPSSDDEYDDYVETAKIILSAMYNRTQKLLRSVGVKSLVAYRGVKGERTISANVGDDRRISGNCMESWTFSKSMGSSFSKGMTGGGDYTKPGVVLKAEIPVERILATPRTGYGCLKELELVVLSGGKDVATVVEKSYNDYVPHRGVPYEKLFSMQDVVQPSTYFKYILNPSSVSTLLSNVKIGYSYSRDDMIVSWQGLEPDRKKLEPFFGEYTDRMLSAIYYGKSDKADDALLVGGYAGVPTYVDNNEQLDSNLVRQRRDPTIADRALGGKLNIQFGVGTDGKSIDRVYIWPDRSVRDIYSVNDYLSHGRLPGIDNTSDTTPAYLLHNALKKISSLGITNDVAIHFQPHGGGLVSMSVRQTSIDEILAKDPKEDMWASDRSPVIAHLTKNGVEYTDEVKEILEKIGRSDILSEGEEFEREHPRGKAGRFTKKISGSVPTVEGAGYSAEDLQKAVYTSVWDSLAPGDGIIRVPSLNEYAALYAPKLGVVEDSAFNYLYSVWDDSHVGPAWFGAQFAAADKFDVPTTDSTIKTILTHAKTTEGLAARQSIKLIGREIFSLLYSDTQEAIASVTQRGDVPNTVRLYRGVPSPAPVSNASDGIPGVHVDDIDKNRRPAETWYTSLAAAKHALESVYGSGALLSMDVPVSRIIAFGPDSMQGAVLVGADKGDRALDVTDTFRHVISAPTTLVSSPEHAITPAIDVGSFFQSDEESDAGGVSVLLDGALQAYSQFGPPIAPEAKGFWDKSIAEVKENLARGAIGGMVPDPSGSTTSSIFDVNMSVFNNDSVRESTKMAVVAGIHNQLIIERSVVNSLIRTWAESSNKTEESSRVQLAAHLLFGAKLHDWQTKTIGDRLDLSDDEMGGVDAFTETKVERTILSKMYEITQKMFADAGIKKVRLYRGVSGGAYDIGDADVVASKANALESWAVSPEVASRFVKESEYARGPVLVADVPVERILCTATTGMGCLAEYEMVVIGGGEQDKFSVYIRGADPTSPPLADADVSTLHKELLANKSIRTDCLGMQPYVKYSDEGEYMFMRAFDYARGYGFTTVDGNSPGESVSAIYSHASINMLNLNDVGTGFTGYPATVSSSWHDLAKELFYADTPTLLLPGSCVVQGDDTYTIFSLATYDGVGSIENMWSDVELMTAANISADQCMEDNVANFFVAMAVEPSSDKGHEIRGVYINDGRVMSSRMTPEYEAHNRKWNRDVLLPTLRQLKNLGVPDDTPIYLDGDEMRYVADDLGTLAQALVGAAQETMFTANAPVAEDDTFERKHPRGRAGRFAKKDEVDAGTPISGSGVAGRESRGFPNTDSRRVYAQEDFSTSLSRVLAVPPYEYKAIGTSSLENLKDAKDHYAEVCDLDRDTVDWLLSPLWAGDMYSDINWGIIQASAMKIFGVDAFTGAPLRAANNFLSEKTPPIEKRMADAENLLSSMYAETQAAINTMVKSEASGEGGTISSVRLYRSVLVDKNLRSALTGGADVRALPLTEENGIDRTPLEVWSTSIEAAQKRMADYGVRGKQVVVSMDVPLSRVLTNSGTINYKDVVILSNKFDTAEVVHGLTAYTGMDPQWKKLTSSETHAIGPAAATRIEGSESWTDSAGALLFLDDTMQVFNAPESLVSDYGRAGAATAADELRRSVASSKRDGIIPDIGDYSSNNHIFDVGSARSEMKRKVVSSVETASSLSNMEANDYVGSWAESSNKVKLSQEIQLAAHQLFGSELHPWQVDQIVDSLAVDKENLDTQETAELISKARDFVAATYKVTQTRLADAGIKSMRLYRGVRGGRYGAMDVGDVVTTRSNALESWSLSRSVAGEFVYGGGAEQGPILVADVPVERIFSTATTGLGCLPEYEVVVIGGGRYDTVGVSSSGADVTKSWLSGSTIQSLHNVMIFKALPVNHKTIAKFVKYYKEGLYGNKVGYGNPTGNPPGIGFFTVAAGRKYDSLYGIESAIIGPSDTSTLGGVDYSGKPDDPFNEWPPEPRTIFEYGRKILLGSCVVAGTDTYSVFSLGTYNGYGSIDAMWADVELMTSGGITEHDRKKKNVVNFYIEKDDENVRAVYLEDRRSTSLATPEDIAHNNEWMKQSVSPTLEALRNMGVPDSAPVYLVSQGFGYITTDGPLGQLQHVIAGGEKQTKMFGEDAAFEKKHPRNKAGRFSSKTSTIDVSGYTGSSSFRWGDWGIAPGADRKAVVAYVENARKMVPVLRKYQSDDIDYAIRIMGGGHDDWPYLTSVETLGIALGKYRNSDGLSSKLKDAVASSLSADTGLPYEVVNATLASWAWSANDSLKTSLASQVAVSNLFGVPLSEWQQEKLNRVLEPEKYGEPVEGPLHGADIFYSPEEAYYLGRTFEQMVSDSEKIVSAMYTRTQTFLRDAGIDELIVFRGVNKDEYSQLHIRDEVRPSENAVESWSLDDATAEQFMMRYKTVGEDLVEIPGAVLAMRVPAKRVLCMPSTGFGCLSEFEALLIGNAYDRCVVHKTRDLSESDPEFEQKHPRGKAGRFSKKSTGSLYTSDRMAGRVGYMSDFDDRESAIATVLRTLGGMVERAVKTHVAGVVPFADASDWRLSRHNNEVANAVSAAEAVGWRLTNNPDASRSDMLDFILSRWDDNTIRACMKLEIANELSGRVNSTGKLPNKIEPGTVLESLHAWTSTNVSYSSAPLQVAASKLFGANINEYQRGSIARARKEEGREAWDKHVDLSEALLAESYAWTQEMFRDAGITEVTIYRGVRLREFLNDTPYVGDVLGVKSNAMESWTLSDKMGEYFARGIWGTGMSREDLPGVVLEMTVPVERIVCSSATGWGCLGEGELIISGNEADKATVVYVHRGSPPPAYPVEEFYESEDFEQKHPRDKMGQFAKKRARNLYSIESLAGSTDYMQRTKKDVSALVSVFGAMAPVVVDAVDKHIAKLAVPSAHPMTQTEDPIDERNAREDAGNTVQFLNKYPHADDSYISASVLAKWDNIGVRSSMKNEIVEELTARINAEGLVSSRRHPVHQMEVSKFLSDWASSNVSRDSAATHVAASRLFGTPIRKYQEPFIADAKLAAAYMWDERVDLAEAILKASYDRTQEIFKKAGIKEVTVFRGVRMPNFLSDVPEEGNTWPVESNPLESWSLSSDIAQRFADGTWMTGAHLDDYPAVVYRMTVPVERIVSSSISGIGCLSEGEVILSGNELDRAKVVFSQRGSMELVPPMSEATDVSLYGSVMAAFGGVFSARDYRTYLEDSVGGELGDLTGVGFGVGAAGSGKGLVPEMFGKMLQHMYDLPTQEVAEARQHGTLDKLFDPYHMRLSGTCIVEPSVTTHAGTTTADSYAVFALQPDGSNGYEGNCLEDMWYDIELLSDGNVDSGIRDWSNAVDFSIESSIANFSDPRFVSVKAIYLTDGRRDIAGRIPGDDAYALKHNQEWVESAVKAAKLLSHMGAAPIGSEAVYIEQDSVDYHSHVVAKYVGTMAEVVKASAEELTAMIDNAVEKQAVPVAEDDRFERLHPRDKGGRFSKKSEEPVLAVGAVEPLNYRNSKDYVDALLLASGIGSSDDVPESGYYMLNDPTKRPFVWHKDQIVYDIELADDNWNNAIARAVCRGDIELRPAGRGYYQGGYGLYGSGFDGEQWSWSDFPLPDASLTRQGQQLLPMPNRLYHVTTAYRAIEQSGGTLKSRHDLAMYGRAKGLGGGSERTISFTDSYDVAHDIIDVMGQAARFMQGMYTVYDLMEWAVAGKTADRPFYRDWVKLSTGITDWSDDENLPQRLLEIADGREYVRLRPGDNPSDVLLSRGRKPKFGGEPSAGNMYGEWEPVNRDVPGVSMEGRVVWGRTIAKSDLVDMKFRLFTEFLMCRRSAGGQLDPVFWGTDPEYFTNLDYENDLAILTYEPVNNKCMAVRLGGLDEWRVFGGEAMKLTDVSRPFLPPEKVANQISVASAVQPPSVTDQVDPSSDTEAVRSHIPAGMSRMDKKLDISGISGDRSRLGKAVRGVLSAINSVHGVSDLPRIPLKQTSGSKFTGGYAYNTRTGDAIRIQISSNGTYPMNSFAHEVGHFIDHYGVDGHRLANFATANGDTPILDGLEAAFINSKAFGRLKELWSSPPGTNLKIPFVSKRGDREIQSLREVSVDKRYVQYLMRGSEMFARGYAQYVAVRSGRDDMAQELDQIRQSEYPTQWEDDDFEPIAVEFDKLFEKMGWRI